MGIETIQRNLEIDKFGFIYVSNEMILQNLAPQDLSTFRKIQSKFGLDVMDQRSVVNLPPYIGGAYSPEIGVITNANFLASSQIDGFEKAVVATHEETHQNVNPIIDSVREHIDPERISNPLLKGISSEVITMIVSEGAVNWALGKAQLDRDSYPDLQSTNDLIKKTLNAETFPQMIEKLFTSTTMTAEEEADAEHHMINNVLWAAIESGNGGEITDLKNLRVDNLTMHMATVWPTMKKAFTRELGGDEYGDPHKSASVGIKDGHFESMHLRASHLFANSPELQNQMFDELAKESENPLERTELTLEGFVKELQKKGYGHLQFDQEQMQNIYANYSVRFDTEKQEALKNEAKVINFDFRSTQLAAA